MNEYPINKQSIDIKLDECYSFNNRGNYMMSPLKVCFKKYEKECVKEIVIQIKKIQNNLEEDQALLIETHTEDGKKVLKINWDEFNSNVQESEHDLLGFTPMSLVSKTAISEIEKNLNEYMIQEYIGFDNTLTPSLNKYLNCTIKRTGILSHKD